MPNPVLVGVNDLFFSAKITAPANLLGIASDPRLPTPPLSVQFVKPPTSHRMGRPGILPGRK